MTRYRRYMDGVEAPEGLTERLEKLKPERRIRPAYLWRAAGIAAALALCVGLGTWAALSGRDRQGLGEQIPLAPKEAGNPVTGEPGEAPAAPPTAEPYAPGFILTEPEEYDPPELTFADGSGLPQVSADYALGAVNRDIRVEDLVAIFRGREQMLGWPVGTQYSGQVYFTKEGEPSGAMVYVAGGDFELTLELLKGAEVPSCVVFPQDDYATTQVGDVTVTALSAHQGENSALVSFYLEGVGYKATIQGEDWRDLAELLVGRCIEEPLTLENVRQTYDVTAPEPPTAPGEPVITEAPGPQAVQTPGPEPVEPPEG